MSTLSSSSPMLVTDGFGSAFPRIFIAATTLVTSAVADTGRWAGYGAGSRGLAGVGLALGDVLIHVASTGAAKPGLVSLHSVIGNTLDQATSSASTAFNYAFDATVSLST